MNDPQNPNRVHSVILRLGDRYCSVPVDCVREMTILPEIKQLCGTASFVPGVITLRGEAIPVIDLRKRLGLRDVMEGNRELVEVLEQSERDHLHWLAELEACVHEGRRFTLGKDPVACKFGRWLAEFRPRTRELGHLIQGFAEPHAAIHGVARKVTRLIEQGQQAEALALLEKTRATDLDLLTKRFEQVYDLLSVPPRMIVTVIRIGAEQVGLIVDEVASLGWVRAEAGDISREATQLDGLFAGMGRNESNSEMVAMLEPESLRVHAA